MLFVTNNRAIVVTQVVSNGHIFDAITQDSKRPHV